MNVYDFDGTIYKKDSSVEFYKYCLKQNKKVLFALPRQIWGLGMYIMSFYNKTQLKESFFSFLRFVDNVDEEVTKFWKIQFEGDNISEWYWEKHMPNDVIISASPFFLVNEAAKQLDINKTIASDVNKKNGHFESKNCKGEEKVRRFQQELSKGEIEEFYSDSKSDTPVACLAKRAYRIKKEEISEWNFDDEDKVDFIETVRYAFWGGITTAINLLLFALFVEFGVPYTFSNVVTYFIAVVISYFLNKRFVFKQSKTDSTLLSIAMYMGIRVLSITFETFVLWVCVDFLCLNVYVSKVMISVLVIVVTYVLNKVLVFKKN